MGGPRALARLVLLFALAAGCVAGPGGDEPGAPTPAPTGGATFPAIRFETDHGAFTAILYPDRAPKTVAFVSGLVEGGYYDGREFNRVIPGFVIQEVDRAGGATDQPEKVPLEAGTDAYFSAGALGIARDADPDSGGSEFFVMDFAHSHLWPNYTVFAQVVEGLDVVHAIARVDAVSTRPPVPVPAPAPLPGLPVHDRVAVVPAKISRATLAEVALDAADAARYPLVVGDRTVEGATRYTPEWPRSLAPGVASGLTWYVYTPPDAPMPDLAGAQARVLAPDGRNLTFAFEADPADARILHWSWTPDSAGEHVLMLEVGGRVVAANRVVL